MATQTRTRLELPSRDEAGTRLAALDYGARYRVKTATHRREVLEEPVLAAAVVASARRERHRLRWLAAAIGVAAVVGMIAAVVAGTLTWWQALLVVLLLAAAMGIRIAVTAILIRKSEQRHAAVLEEAGSVPPAGPSMDLDGAHIGRTRASRRVLAASSVVLAMVAAIAWVSWQDQQIAARLDQRGDVAQARVVDTQSHRKLAALLLSDRHVVTFQTRDGRAVEATVIKEEELSIEDGDIVEVRYDPRDPTVARLAGDTDGRSEHLWIGLSIAGVLMLVIGLSQWRLRRESRGPTGAP